MRTAIDLNEFAEAFSAISWLVDAPAGGSRNPHAGLDHPGAQRLRGQRDPVNLEQLLVSQGRPEVAVVALHERQSLLALRPGQAAVTGSATPLRAQSSGAFGLERPHQPAHLALANAQHLSGLTLREPLVGNALQNL